MEDDTYLVLRVLGAEPDTGDLFDPHTVLRTTGTSGPADLEIRVETAVLDGKDHAELRRDREVAGLARPIPIRLIQPVSRDKGSVEPPVVNEATWGVYVTGALNSPYVGRGVTVAVLDTGIDAGHEAFAGVDLTERDFTGEGNGDPHGHGTHVAGTIFGRACGGPRYAVAPGVTRALIGKVIGTGASSSTKEMVDAIQWAADNGAHVVNMSLGIDFPGLVEWWVGRGMPVALATSRALAEYRDNVRFLDRLVALLRARGAYGVSPLLVAAAGNESRRDEDAHYRIDVSPPAAAEGVVSVAALRSLNAAHTSFTVASFSNTRAVVSAPGCDVYSAKAGGGFTSMNGTSMASPHVAGVAALWAEQQLRHRGEVSMQVLEAQLLGRARQDGLLAVSYEDIGAGLVTAP